MNSFPKDTALCDRIHIIEVPGYTVEDQINIVRDYLFPKTLKNINLPPTSINISKSLAKNLIEQVCDPDDCGVRTLEKVVTSIVTKVDFLVKHQNKKGKLVGFDMSFDPGKIMRYPITLDRQLLEKLC